MSSPSPAARGLVWGLLLAGILLAGTVSAHANLVGAEPRANSRVDEAPTELVLRFSEALEDRYTRVEVIAPSGSDVAEATRIDPNDRTRATVPLGPMPDGLYTVRWRTLSAADGHTRAGVYLLGVNTSLTASGDPGSGGPGPSNATDPSNVTAPSSDSGGPGEMLVRGLGFTGASLAVGVPLFTLVSRGVDVPSAVRRRWSTLAIAGGGLAAVASLGLLWILATSIDSPIAAAADTTPGANLLLRVLVFGAAMVLTLAGERGPWPELRPALTGSGTLAAAAGLLVTSLGSHAAAGGIGSGISIVVDWVHQLAVAFWVSGVAALVVAGLASTPERAGARLVRRFSPLAVASVLAIVATGVIASFDRLTSLGDLVDGLYGFALSAKMLLLVPLVALGAYHRYVLLPDLEEPGQADRDRARLWVSAGIELAVMVVVLLAAGVLTTASPPVADDDGAPYASFDEALAADTPGPYDPLIEESNLTTLDESQARRIKTKVLVPARTDGLDPGPQPVWLLVYDEGERAPVTDAEITLEAWMTQHGHGTSPEEDPTHVSEGSYRGRTTWSMPGDWDLRLNVTLPSGDVLRYVPSFRVGDPSQIPDPPPEPVHAFEEDGFRLETFVTPQPVTIGAQNVTIEVTPEDGSFPHRAEVLLKLNPPSDPYGEGETVELTRWRNDTWSAEGPIFVEEGTWRVLVGLQGKGTYVQDTFELEVEGR